MRRGYPLGMAKVRDRLQSAATTQALGAWVRDIMARRGVDQVMLAHMSGVDQSMISRARNGQVSDMKLLQIAAALKATVPPELLPLTTKGRRPRGAPELPTAGATLLTGVRPHRAGFDVPVLPVLPQPRGPVFLLQTAVSEFTWRPPCLANAREAFVLRMPDSTMAPWRQPHEPIYCDPDRDIAGARHAALQLASPGAHELWVICALDAPPVPGQPPAAHLYQPRRGYPIPALPVRRAIAVVEWPDLMPT
jgi:hypothetical protein